MVLLAPDQFTTCKKRISDENFLLVAPWRREYQLHSKLFQDICSGKVYYQFPFSPIERRLPIIIDFASLVLSLLVSAVG